MGGGTPNSTFLSSKVKRQDKQEFGAQASGPGVENLPLGESAKMVFAY